MHKGRDGLISPKEAEEGVEIVSKICGVDKEKINYPTVECNGVSISEQEFDFFPRELLDTDFKYEIKFTNCKFGCLEYFCLYKTNNSFLIFENCEFDYICLNNDLVTDNTFELNNKLYFFGCRFNEDIDIGKANINGEIKFNGCIFKDVFYFGIEEYLANIKIKNCIFYKSFFMSGSFKNEARFDNSIFKDYADFHECEFEKIACFYGARFDKAPNFSQVIFKGNLNAVNTNLNFTFRDLQEKIKQECENFNKTKEEQDKKPLDKFANDFRDSFRTFKNALIKDNNLLDASNFHKYELYCKEIELKQNWDKKGKNVENMADLEKSVSRIRDFVDFLLLGFYRKLCDHHTDFLKVFNNLILLIVLYTLFFSGFVWFHDDKLEDTRAILTLFGFFDKFKFCFNIGVGICIVTGAILVLYKIDKISIKSFSNILKIFQYLPYIKKWLLKIFKKEIFIKIFLKLKIIVLDLGFLIESLIIILFIPCIFYVLFSLFGFLLNLGKDFEHSLFINILFVSLYICLVYTKSLFFGRYAVLIFSYIGFFIMFIKQPNIIHPLIGKIANESDKFFNYPSLIVLNILYTILLALVLFSLQKTARKNSIVPI